MTTESNKTKQVKALIETNGSKIMSVKFIKKNGEPRVMAFNPKNVRGIKGEAGDPVRVKQMESRKVTHPNLISVQDQSKVVKGVPAEQCWRSINCDTVTSITIGGVEYAVNG